jgi:hypothetical protein
MKKAIEKRSKGEIITASLLLILFVGVATTFAVISLSKEKPVTPDKISSLMLKSSSEPGGGLSSTFSMPDEF